jgi:hypothetical protein
MMAAAEPMILNKSRGDPLRAEMPGVSDADGLPETGIAESGVLWVLTPRRRIRIAKISRIVQPQARQGRHPANVGLILFAGLKSQSVEPRLQRGCERNNQ